MEMKKKCRSIQDVLKSLALPPVAAHNLKLELAFTFIYLTLPQHESHSSTPRKSVAHISAP